MKAPLLVLCCLCCTLSVSSQLALPTYVFPVSADQAEQIYRYEQDTVDVTILGNPIDSFLIQKKEQPRLPGHYLYVRPNLENLEIYLRSYHSFELQLRNNDRDLALEVIDAAGNRRDDALVQRKKRIIPYDPETQTYRIRHTTKDGFLKVKIEDETLFYELNGTSRKPLLFRKIKYWRSSKVGYWLTTPIRWVENTYQYFRRGIAWGDWRWYRNPFRFLQREQSFRGYIAMNQPVYRPGDTLQLKAYLANRKGKPWSKPTQLRITSYQPKTLSDYQTHLDTLLDATEPGSFLFNWVLSDSLTSDLTYNIYLDHPKSDNFEGLSHQFKLEDYELDEAEFSLSLSQKEFRRGEKIAIQAEGKDKNDQFVVGAEVRLVLITKAIDAIYQDSLSVADTLWTSRESLRNRGNTQLLIPDSIFPAADLQMILQANFVHPSGELHQKEETFRFQHSWDELVLKVEGDTMLMEYQKDGQSLVTQAYLTRSGIASQQVKLMLDTIQLPHREALSPYLSQYELSANGHTQKLDLTEKFASQVSVGGSWQADTIMLTFNNPRRLPINWMLQSRTKEIQRGLFSERSGAIKIPVSNKRQWELSYEYFWEYPRTEEKVIYRLDKKLEVAIEQPTRVSPGETVAVKVKVKDQYNRPAAGVQLVAAGVNSQFGEISDAYKAPSIPYKTTRKPFVIENFSANPEQEHYLSQKITKDWYNKLDLSRHRFYKMRFENPGVLLFKDTLTQDTFYQKVAQVAPFLLNGSKTLPIYLIYLNRALVYYHDTDDDPPYSFVGQAGYNRISLRTLNAEYTLDSVWLEKGEKLEVAINLDRFQQGMSKVSIQQNTRPEYWWPGELSDLKGGLLSLRVRRKTGEGYIWDRQHNIHRINHQLSYSDAFVLGPFRKNTQLNYVNRGKWEKAFLFEPGFSYQISEKKERLYEWKDWEVRGEKYLPKRITSPMPGELIYRPEDIKRTIETTPDLYFDHIKEERQPAYARIRFLQVPTKVDSIGMLAIVLQSEQGTEWLMPPNPSLIGELEKGNYQVFLVREDGQVKRQQFALLANTTFAINFSNGIFTRDSLRKWPDRLYEYSEARRLYREQVGGAKTSGTNPYKGKGRLITGQLKDENGDPLIGANLLIQGTSTGTVTDFHGNYAIWVPDDATLNISYTGYTSQEHKVGSSNQLDATLEGALHLDEVIVVGYGTTQKRTLTNAVTTLQGRVAGVEVIQDAIRRASITVRGNSTVLTNSPLYFIDGQLAAEADLAKLAPEIIQEVNILQGAEATAIYGAKAIDGVVLIKTLGGNHLALSTPEWPEEASGLRNEFRDYAFWQPQLMTDKNGEAYFQATYPDNITAWDTYVLGMDRKQRAGIGLARTRAWKSLTARLSLPRFLVAGDQTNAIGQAINYTNDSLAITTFFRQGDQELYSKEQKLGDALRETYFLTAPMEGDSISLTYGLEMDNYLDGEKRELPLFPQGSLETEGYFMVLSGDTSLSLSFDHDQYPIKLFAANNTIDLLFEDLKYLQEYPYECMEQTASRLIALCLEKLIRKTLEQTFAGEKEVAKMLQRLEKAQRPDGSWGWWPGRESSLWITLHVLKAIHLATPENRNSESLEKGLRYLISELPSLKSKERLLTLVFLATTKQNLDYATYLDSLDTLNLPLYDQLLMTRIRQKKELPYQLDTLDKYRQQTLYGAYFWTNKDGSSWNYYGRYNNSIATSLLAYELLHAAGRTADAAKIQQYFLEQRGIGRPQGYRAWYNTYETARVLATILPDLLGEDAKLEPSRLLIETSEQQQVKDFPYQNTWPGSHQMTIQKSGTGPVYLTAYQQYHNPKPLAKSDVFSISTKMIQKEIEVTELTQGDLAELEVKLKMDAQAEYVMVEIPIPAGCSYADRSEKRNQLEDHREYQREKVVIFCSRLPLGEHTFKVSLEPRFTGRFTLNPARAEQMYFPVLYGRDAMKVVEIKE